MKRIRRAIIAVATSIVASALVLVVAPPAFAAPGSTPPVVQYLKATKHCVTVVAHAAPGSKEVRVVSQSCTTGTERPAIPAGITLLGTVYGEAGMQGDEDALEGQDGTCDTGGYGFSALDGPNLAVGGIRSYELYGNCDASEYYSGYNFTGSFSGLLVTQSVFSLEFFPMNSIDLVFR